MGSRQDTADGGQFITGVLVGLHQCGCQLGNRLGGRLQAVDAQSLPHDAQLGSAGHVGQVLERPAGDSREHSFVDGAADSPCLDQSVVDIPQHQYGCRSVCRVRRGHVGQSAIRGPINLGATIFPGQVEDVGGRGSGMDDDRARAIGERVRLYRTAARRTKTVVAGLTGITPEYLYQIERGLKIPTVAVLVQLAEVLGVSAGELIDQQHHRDARQCKTATGDAICRALTAPTAVAGEPLSAPELRRRVHTAWETWQTSPYRYRKLSVQLPMLITDTERALRDQLDADNASRRRAVQGCAADLYGLLRTVTKRIGRVDLSLLAAERAVRMAEAADDPLRLATARWNLAQVLLSDGTAEGVETVAMHAADALRCLIAQGNDDAAALHGALLLIAAIAAARHGDVWTARDRLHEAAPFAERTGERNTGWTAFGPTNVAMYAVCVEVESGEAVEGLRLAERVDHEQSPSIERRVAFLLDQVKGYEQRRDHAAALKLMVTAEREAPEDIQYRPAAHLMLRALVQRGRRSVAAEAAQMAMRVGLSV